jgi:hypothetical protein
MQFDRSGVGQAYIAIGAITEGLHMHPLKEMHIRKRKKKQRKKKNKYKYKNKTNNKKTERDMQDFAVRNHV